MTSRSIGIASPNARSCRTTVDFWFNGRTSPTDVPHVINGVARLKPGATIEQLFADGNAAMKQLGRTVPSAEGREWVMQPLVTSLVGDLGPVLAHRAGRDRTAAGVSVRQRHESSVGPRRGPHARRWRCAARSAPVRAASSGSCSPSRWCWRPAALSRASRSPRLAVRLLLRSADRRCRAWSPCRWIRPCCCLLWPC